MTFLNNQLIFNLDNKIYLKGELINRLIKAGFPFYIQYTREDPSFTIAILSCNPTGIFELYSCNIDKFTVSEGLRTYCIHWSDCHQQWGEPKEITPFTKNLGLPFAYFLANLSEYKEYVKTLPPLQAVSKIGTYPDNFFIGKTPIF